MHDTCSYMTCIFHYLANNMKIRVLWAACSACGMRMLLLIMTHILISPGYSMAVLFTVSDTPAAQGLQKAANDAGCCPPLDTSTWCAPRLMQLGVRHSTLGLLGRTWWALTGLMAAEGGCWEANSSASLV